ncbi:MAG: lipid A deacylase LpxR family protein [Gammaproteobacteria bacterium]|nr:lipid A deacylase LpxR family protein [Gammaproteobacteria bacterium]
MSGLLVFRYTLVFMGLFCCFAAAKAEDNPVRERFFSLQYENDLFTSDNRDRYYTSGLQLSLLERQSTPRWLEPMAQWAPFYRAGMAGYNWSQYSFGQKIFTPDDTQSFDVRVDDRPYAGYLYFTSAVMSKIAQEENYDYGNQLEVTLGVVGPSALGEQAQTTVHKVIGSDIPQGWDNQLKDELALGVSYSRFWRLRYRLKNRLEVGVNPQITGVVGNVYTYAAFGAMLRFGYNLKRDFTPPTIRPGFLGVIYFKESKQPSWYGFLGFEGRAIVRDIFLDGNSFKRSHRVEKENLVGDLQYGIVYMFENVRLSYSEMVRTNEFKTQQNRTHYGLFNISVRY